MALKTKRIGGAELVRQIAPVTVNLPSAMPVAEHSPPEPAVETKADKEKHTIVTVNIPLELVAAMREAADRRALRLAREHPKGAADGLPCRLSWLRFCSVIATRLTNTQAPRRCVPPSATAFGAP